jgi:hypothetical protein
VKRQAVDPNQEDAEGFIRDSQPILAPVCGGCRYILAKSRLSGYLNCNFCIGNTDMNNDAVANGDPVTGTAHKPWIIPAATDALEPQDIANSYQLHQDSNPHASNDAS